MVVAEGQILIAKSVLKMKDGTGNALVIGKEYPIKKIIRDIDVVIESENCEEHYFDMLPGKPGYFGKYLTVKE